jgi:hypothetical protein
VINLLQDAVEEHCMQAIFAQTIRAKHMYPGGAGRTERGVGGGQREVWEGGQREVWEGGQREVWEGGQREVWEGGQREVWGEGAGAQLTVLLSIYLS